ncbi:uncharacterized protein [Aegilops tauschii subsp. strangulata]|uniref:uncharacterized protein n=1 Tax=Aegilops tauschii subsp. strangulata TaxID=200361 RepID=UPI00098A8904|nr:uncharacterized protein LOC109775256 [Aegilops tauschii subsp. strangulata]
MCDFPGHFISKLGERALPFFRRMKRKGSFEWTSEAEATIEDLKRYLTSPPIMVAPRFREPLVLCLLATSHFAIATLVAVREERVSTQGRPDSPCEAMGPLEPSTPQGGVPKPPALPFPGEASGPLAPRRKQAAVDAPRLVEHLVYFVSTVLRDARACYAMQQKLLLALLVASRKLRHYFQGHPIKVVSAYHLEKNIELQAFQLEFCTTRVIKGATLADFVAEWTDTHDWELREDQSLKPGDEAPNGWVTHFDGAFARQGAGAGVLLVSLTKDKLCYAVQLCFHHSEKVSNTIAEYEGLIAGLKAKAALGVKRLTIKGDCQLLHVSRGANKEADDVAKQASRREPQNPGVFEERLFKPSATPSTAGTTLLLEELPPAPAVGAPACGSTSGAHLLLAMEAQAGSWVEELKAYLLRDTLPEKDAEAKRMARQAIAYCLRDDERYHKRPNNVSLRCILEDQGRELLADIHGGGCRHHSSSRTLVGKAFRSGFYCPTALHDATELVRSCEACQFQAKQIHQPAQRLQTIPLSWPFVVWGLDILGTFPRVAGGYHYLYVAIDKFTKWAEVEPVRTIPARSAIKFIKGLVSRFGVPNRIITDNRSQFTSNLFRGLKTRSFNKKLEACGKGWLDELLSVLWFIHTTATKPTGKTPFFLVYGVEAVLPSEIKHGSPRVLAFDEACQDASRETDQVLDEEARR